MQACLVDCNRRCNVIAIPMIQLFFRACLVDCNKRCNVIVIPMVQLFFKACLVNCNKRYNVIIIPMVQLFFSLVMFLLQRIIIPYEQLFFKMRNKYSSLKVSINYFLVSAITSKLNIFPSKKTFHIHLTIIKIKNDKNNTYLS